MKKEKKIKRTNIGQFVPGVCPNPNGRPSGVKQKAKDACEKHGVDPLDFFASVVADKKAPLKEQIACAKELADRMYGKAPQFIETESTIKTALDDILLLVDNGQQTENHTEDKTMES